MLSNALDTVVNPFAKLLERNSMQIIGVNNTMRIARAYNRLKFGKFMQYRRNQYLKHFDELMDDNGLPVSPLNELKDGWVIDTSGKLPHLEQLLDEADEIIRERGGVKRAAYGRPFFQELLTEEHLITYPSILKFATSSEVLSPICNYLKFIPVLSEAQPHGVRLIESHKKLDDTPDAPPRASQLFHLDYHDSPMAYAIVVLKDVTMENGPFCFLSESESQKACSGLKNYHSIRGGHRVKDEDMYKVVSEEKLVKLCYPAGTVLFLDNSKCFHYGSRNAVKPRYLMMYAYLSPCRTDFAEIIRETKKHPIHDNDSKLRKMVLDRNLME